MDVWGKAKQIWLNDNPIPEIFNIIIQDLGEIPAVEKACIVCGGRTFYTLNTFLLNGRRFHTVRCLQDYMMWLEPQLTAQFYETLYSTRYHATGEEDPLLEQATLEVHTNMELRRHYGRIRIARTSLLHFSTPFLYP